METDKKSSANILKAYLRYLKLERNYSPNTLDAYSHDIAWLMDYCKREERDTSPSASAKRLVTVLLGHLL